MVGEWMDGRVNGKEDEWMDLRLWENEWRSFYWAQMRPSEKDPLFPQHPTRTTA